MTAMIDTVPATAATSAGVADRVPMPVTRPGPPRLARGRRGGSLPTGWPLSALLVLYPLWWILGLPTFIYILAAVPMAVTLLRRRRTLRVPPAFGFWLVLLVWVGLSGLLLAETAPGTLPSFGTGRIIGFVIRLATYLGLTVIMLYVMNLEERELPRLRVIRMLGIVGVFTVAGGFAGVYAPDFTLTSPIAYLLPESIVADPFVRRVVTLETAQVQDVLPGVAGSSRPSAPFEYTNTWGENLAVLVIWLIVGWSVLGRGWRRVAGATVAALAVVPIVASLNRGLWAAVAISAVYVALRLASRGRLATLGALAAGAGVFAVLLLITPVGTLIGERFATGHSDDIREKLRAGAVRAAASSPVLGYGANRPLIGSGRSIAIGKSAECPQCGNREIGSDGQLWQLLVAQGFVGAICYNAFFLWNLWRFRRDHSATGIAGSLVLILMLFFQTLYGALDSTLALALISVALLARNDRHLRQSRRARVAGAMTGRSEGAA